MPGSPEALAAIDPGTHTALAWTPSRCRVQDLHERLRTEEWYCGSGGTRPADVYPGEMKMAQGVVRSLKQIHEEFGLHTLLIEDFSPRMMNRSRSFLSPVRVTCFILSGLGRFHIKPVALEFPPSSAMSVLNDERLKRLGLWVVGSPHRRAATRHLASYLGK